MRQQWSLCCLKLPFRVVVFPIHPTEQILGGKPWCRARAVNYADVHSAPKLGTYLSSAFKKDTSTVYVDPNNGKVCRCAAAAKPPTLARSIRTLGLRWWTS